MLSLDVSESVHKLKPTCVRSFDTQEWVTDLSVVIEQDNMKDPRNLAHQLWYLLECPRLRKLTIKTGRGIMMIWENDWTRILEDLQLKIGKGLKVVYDEL